MSIDVLPCLSLKQPWASLVAWKLKRNETRAQHFTQLAGQWFAVHASKTWHQDQRQLLDTEPFKSALAHCGITASNATQATLPVGAIVAVAFCGWAGRSDDLQVGEPERTFGDYRPGRWVYGLGQVYQLHAPILYTGRLGVWNLPHDLVRRVLDGVQGYRDLPDELKVL